MLCSTLRCHARCLILVWQQQGSRSSPRPPCRTRRSYHTGKPAAFLWQWIGSALFFLFPAITYTLQARLRACTADAAAGCRRWPQLLLVCLLVCAAWHALQSW